MGRGDVSYFTLNMAALSRVLEKQNVTGSSILTMGGSSLKSGVGGSCDLVALCTVGPHREPKCPASWQTELGEIGEKRGVKKAKERAEFCHIGV